MEESAGRSIGRTILGDRKKIILEVIIGVIVTLSLVGNAWALWNHMVTKKTEAAYSEGWRTSLLQFVSQSEGCKPVNVNLDESSETFINVKCVTAPPAGEQAATER